MIAVVRTVSWNGEEWNVFHFIVTEPVHEISNNVVCATSKASDQPAHTRSLIRAFASRWIFYDCYATD